MLRSRRSHTFWHSGGFHPGLTLDAVLLLSDVVELSAVDGRNVHEKHGRWGTNSRFISLVGVRDVELNLRVWQELAGDCELPVDVRTNPVRIRLTTSTASKSSLGGRTYLGILTFREPRAEILQIRTHLRCSPYSLFEIRLAERADDPA